MIIDLPKFIAEERKYWTELEGILNQLETDHTHKLDLDRARRFHYLYQRACADLAKVMTLASEPRTRTYLESLVACAYGEIHETREKPHRFRPLEWFFRTFPQTFRRHARAFELSLAVTLIGCAFGGAALCFDAESKSVLMPFPHLRGDPSERVAQEEGSDRDRLEGGKTMFSSMLMTHNTKVSIFTMALGMTWGVGTILMLFYNGIILGAVGIDYILAGETKFLAGWLLPHGAIEIPAILLAGQAGLVLGGALIGWGDRSSLKIRLRKVGHDVVTLMGGVAMLLVWAGLVEAFLSQYHEPVIPYSLKIAFGLTELVVLAVFLTKAGRRSSEFKVQGSP